MSRVHNTTSSHSHTLGSIYFGPTVFFFLKHLIQAYFVFMPYEVSTSTQWELWKAWTSVKNIPLPSDNYCQCFGAFPSHFFWLFFLTVCVTLDFSGLLNFWKHSGLCNYHSLSLYFLICGWPSGLSEFTVFFVIPSPEIYHPK